MVFLREMSTAVFLNFQSNYLKQSIENPFNDGNFNTNCVQNDKVCQDFSIKINAEYQKCPIITSTIFMCFLMSKTDVKTQESC